MSNALPIEDLSKTYLEHSMVINNFRYQDRQPNQRQLMSCLSVMVFSMNGVKMMIK